ncbi:ATP-binding cassette domain-containing protein, partial [Enterococcus cecorum]|nr:ATP-binding cassette domain-containing protein [Enterococcus cecorum]
LASLDNYRNQFLIDEKKRQSIISKYIKKLRIKTQNEQSKVGSLSGGNQQKVVIAKWLAINPKLLILDEPTRGVDVGARQEIYRVINDLAKEGLAIIMVSSDLPEVINMCDRVCVVKDGSIATTLNKESLTQETIMRYATGG